MMRQAAGIASAIAGITIALCGASLAATGSHTPSPPPAPAVSDGALAAGEANADPAVALLNSFAPKASPYIRPDDIDERFTTALYVNVATRGPHRQRMWVLQRDELGGAWRLGLWDKNYWRRKAQRTKDRGLKPAYSWLVSSGRYYRGERRSGPTPPGIYGLDERRWRYGRGWLSAGMRHVMHIDFHYSSGRPSGVAFHGTDAYRYRKLGRADSHGCIRMKQNLALALINRITGSDGVLSEEMRWGEVPRFWRTEEGRRRSGYRRDGELLFDDALVEHQEASLGPPVAVSRQPGDTAPLIAQSDTAPGAQTPPSALTKEGFRVIVIFFKH